jgi:predicted phosphoribosyltransferase
MMGVPVAEWPVYQRRLAKTVDKQKCRGIPVHFVNLNQFYQWYNFHI